MDDVAFGSTAPASLLIDFQARGRVLLERGDSINPGTKQFFDHFGWLVATTQPDYFWRRANESRFFREVSVERDESKAIGTCVPPNSGVVSFGESREPHVMGTGERVVKLPTEFEAEILVEQKLHVAAVRSRRSRSAA